MKIKAWGGFCDGKLCYEDVKYSDRHDNAIYAVFRTRKAAKELYEDVRPVVITVQKYRGRA